MATRTTAVPDPEVVTEESVLRSLSRERLGVWSTMTTRRVQTNDTSRAVAWLFPAELAGCSGGRRPLALADVGAGAGLNLVADALPRPWTEHGTVLRVPCATDLDTVFRIGFDTRPLDVNDTDAVRWMRACIWSGDDSRRKHPAALVAHVRVRSTVKALRLARCHQHPTELDVDASAVTEFRRAVMAG